MPHESPHILERSGLAAGYREVDASNSESGKQDARVQALSGQGTKQSKDVGKEERGAKAQQQRLAGQDRSEQVELEDAKPESSTNHMNLEDNNRIEEGDYNQKRKETIGHDGTKKEPRWHGSPCSIS